MTRFDEYRIITALENISNSLMDINANLAMLKSHIR